MNIKSKKLITYFLQGLLVFLPLVVTVNVVIILFRFVERFLDNVMVFVPYIYLEIPYVAVVVELTAAALLFGFLTLFGFMVKTLVGRSLVKMMDASFNWIPGLNTIYKATRQVANLLFLEKDRFLTRPVLVEYPSPGIWAIAFNTGRVDGALKSSAHTDHVTVFIPTTPNPTSGFLAVMPVEKIKHLDLSVEEAIKMILTGGMVKSEDQ